MDLKRERKRSLKVREQQEAELERIQATKKRYSHGIDVTVCSTIKFNFTFVGDVKKMPKPRQYCFGNGLQCCARGMYSTEF